MAVSPHRREATTGGRRGGQGQGNGPRSGRRALGHPHRGRRELHRHRDRVVRLLPLRHGRRARLRPRCSSRTSRTRCIGTLVAFGTYAVGFFARPLGGIVFGHFGDRIGRKSMLVLSLLIMGIATFLIGLLPTYDTIGIWAPILLVVLRFVQGIGVGGEWGGAVLMAVEHAPPEQARVLRLVAADGRARRACSSATSSSSPSRTRCRTRVPRVGLAHPVPALASSSWPSGWSSA